MRGWGLLREGVIGSDSEGGGSGILTCYVVGDDCINIIGLDVD